MTLNHDPGPRQGTFSDMAAQTRWIIVRSLAFGPINRLVESWYRRWRLTAEAQPRGWPAPALRSHAEA